MVEKDNNLAEKIAEINPKIRKFKFSKEIEDLTQLDLLENKRKGFEDYLAYFYINYNSYNSSKATITI